MLPKFEPKSFINALEKFKPTFLHLAPPLLAFCADHDGVTREALQSIHHVLTGAAPTGPTLLQRLKEKAPNVIVKEGLKLMLMIFLGGRQMLISFLTHRMGNV
jgi:acyl-CoA synthetase (AMP-forming)/AMP-acid ligase II